MKFYNKNRSVEVGVSKNPKKAQQALSKVKSRAGSKFGYTTSVSSKAYKG